MATALKPAAADAVGQRVVVMIGFMGAGKSTAARNAAEALGSVAVDVDDVIEERLGKPIARIFAEDGEAAFRAAEERFTLELLEAGGMAPGPGVLALGGGAIESPRVREALGRHLVVWIDVDPETAWRRCSGSGRPLAADRSRFYALHAE
ncbi:MAG: shikimate kinase, partial [Solirubrobacteraceae bacterium]